VRVLARSVDRARLGPAGTEPIDLSRLRETTTLVKPLSLPPDTRLLDAEPEEVRVTLTIGRRAAEPVDASDQAP
jgi:hypothetical protein